MIKNLLIFSKTNKLISRIRVRQEFKKSTAHYTVHASANAKLAVIVHLYYKDLWPMIRSHLGRINVPFDLYVSVREEDKGLILEQVNDFQRATNILAFPNRGRDVLPFLQIARIMKQKGNYQFFLKLHTKKSPHRIDGNTWLQSLLDELVPEDITQIITTLEKKDTGSLGPRNHVVSLSKYLGDNRSNIIKILEEITDQESAIAAVNKASLYPFFGGTMFWARMDFIEPILQSTLSPSDFVNESGQVDGTAAHALERIFGGLLHHFKKRNMYAISRTGKVQILEEKIYEDDYRYVG